MLLATAAGRGRSRPAWTVRRLPGSPSEGHPVTLASWKATRVVCGGFAARRRLVLGIALGVVNPGGGSTRPSGWLRVPALLAALILVAQGLLGFQERARAKKKAAAAEQASRADRVAEPDRSQPGGAHPVRRSRHPRQPAVGGGRSRWSSRSRPRHWLRRPARDARPGEPRPHGAVLVLAVWLGLATLNYSNSPPYLLALSLRRVVPALHVRLEHAPEGRHLSGCPGVTRPSSSRRTHAGRGHRDGPGRPMPSRGATCPRRRGAP